MRVMGVLHTQDSLAGRFQVYRHIARLVVEANASNMRALIVRQQLFLAPAFEAIRSQVRENWN